MKSLGKPKQLLNFITASKNKHRFLLAVILIFHLSPTAYAQQFAINPISGKLGKQDTVDLRRLIKYEAHLFNGLLPNPIPDSLPVVINLFSKLSQFNEAKNLAGITVTHTGFYSAATKECYIYKGDNFRQVIIHETSHLLLHFGYNEKVPKWLDEGLAEFFEGLYIDDNGAIYVNPQPARLQRMREYVKDNKLDVAGFLGKNTDLSWNTKKDFSYRYDIAYGLVYYLIKTNPLFVGNILNALQLGKTSPEALTLLYGSVELFETRLKLYYR